MCSNERGLWAIYRKQQPIRNKPCGSPCVASHGFGRMHGGTSCFTWLSACLSIMHDDTTPSTCLDAWPGSMQGDSTSSTCLAAWPGRMHRNTLFLDDPPRAPLVFQHGLLTCRVTQCPLPVWMHGLASCKETPRPPHVWPHGPVACIVTPRAWPIHLVLHLSSCMYRLHVLQHLMLPLTHILPGSCHHVLNTYTSSHLELLGRFGLFRRFW